MKQELIVKCDECNHSFTLEPKRREYPNKIEEVYIECPECKASETAYMTDNHVRKEQQEIKKLHEEYIARKSKLKEYMDRLKQSIYN